MISIREQVPLAPYTTFKIGGPARYFAQAKTVDDVKEALEFARVRELEVFVLGGGSNVLFSDQGFNGLVLKLNLATCEVAGKNLVRCGASATVEQALDLAIDQGLAGLEWAGGLPGTVGGGVRGNAGAFAGEFKDIVSGVHTIDPETQQVKTYNNAACRFSYRDSVFKHNQDIIVEVTLTLQPGDPNRLYDIAQDHIRYRKERHPLELGNAGSMFKNTAVTKLPPALVQAWREVIKNDPFPVVPTAKIIADAGLAGFQSGRAQVSPKHTNYVVNLGGATADDVKRLVRAVKQKVREEFNIELEEEVQILP